MRGFNSPLTSKSQLEKFTKQQLIDMYWYKCEDDKEFLDRLENMSFEEFEKMKYTIKIFKYFAKNSDGK